MTILKGLKYKLMLNKLLKISKIKDSTDTIY